ncbi:hypothetical protein CPB85DRAFT_1224105 [Mucidula mucida]|nr:hypothetical protein CPB85DRAFT_1224105 [Mucidula mucida]
MFFKSLVVFTFLATALATPVKRESTTCDFVMTPSEDRGVDALQHLLTLLPAVGRTVGETYPDTFSLGIGCQHSRPPDDGTYDVHSVIEVTDVPAAEVAAVVEAWAERFSSTTRTFQAWISNGLLAPPTVTEILE